ncbi:hypothetical protein MMC25_005094 [Agyrium rufum]|nr:hypothetical protein [Agyrium rufum]
MSTKPSTPTNSGAWLLKAGTPLAVQPAPYTRPTANEIVIRNHAIAINPIDWYKQNLPSIIFGWNKLPFITGWDVAGEVVEVGPGDSASKRFKVGDRVVGLAVGMDKRWNQSAGGAFQLYPVLRADLVSPIPDAMSYAEASCMPLGLSTAATALFTKSALGLQYPSPNAKATGETVLVWGGSTSVGSNAIQLGVAAGYEVFTTASPKNYEYVRKLGAAQVFDYKSPTVTKDIIAALKGKKVAGAVAIGHGATTECICILAASQGKKLIAQATGPVPDPMPSTTGAFMMALPGTMFGFGKEMIKGKINGVSSVFINGADVMADDYECGKAIFRDFLPSALAEGRFAAAPGPVVVGQGLEMVQEGFERHKKGVSAKKVVIEL